MQEHSSSYAMACKKCIKRWHVWFVVDSKARKHIDAMWLDFTKDPKNLRFALITDGMNPFGDFNFKHSTWAILLLLYNLTPWLVTNIFFVMLSLIILGKKSIKDTNMDTYMAPLIEELQELWRGVIAFDVSIEVGKQSFKLQGILMWTIHDFPAYGLIAGCVTKGYKGCPICGPAIVTQYSKHMKKMVYIGHRN